MNKWLLGLVGILFAFALVPAQAQQFEEGKHYEVIADEATAEPEVKEFFSFYCVHCFRYEPIAQQMAAAFGDEFSKAHVSFIDPRGMGVTMSRAYAAAKMLKVDKEVSETIFDYNFNKQAMLLSKEDIRNAFVVNGVSGDEFDKAMASFSVRGMANKYDREATKYKVTGTPTFIINGKYKLDPAGFQDSDDFVADFVAAADYLMQKSD